MVIDITIHTRLPEDLAEQDADNRFMTESNGQAYQIASKLVRVENPTDKFSFTAEELDGMPMSLKLKCYYEFYFPWESLCAFLCQNPAVRVGPVFHGILTPPSDHPLPSLHSSRDPVTGFRLLQVCESLDEINKYTALKLAPLIQELKETQTSAKRVPLFAEVASSSVNAVPDATRDSSISLVPNSPLDLSSHVVFGSFSPGSTSRLMPNSAFRKLAGSSSPAIVLEPASISMANSPSVAALDPFKPGMPVSAAMELSCASSASPLSDTKSDVFQLDTSVGASRKRHVSSLYEEHPLDADGIQATNGHDLLDVSLLTTPLSLGCPASTSGMGDYEFSSSNPLPRVTSNLNANAAPDNQISLALRQREFAFSSFQGNATSFMRYVSVRTPKELRDLMSMYCPSRFEIGPMFIRDANNKDSAMANVPKYHELVIDIDITDYDAVRPCCRGNKRTCHRCWKLIKFAMKMITRVLREEFGLKAPQWVFSGHKGVHCWYSGMVSLLREASRRHIVEYLSIKQKSTLLKKPYIRKCLESMIELFIDRVKNDNILEDPAIVNHLLSFVPSTQLRIELGEIKGSSIDRWVNWYTKISFASDRIAALGHRARATELKQSLDLMIIEATAPRLDESVTISKGHLLKSPYCIHPTTSKPCVPIAVEDIETFNPDCVPTLEKILSRKITTFIMK